MTIYQRHAGYDLGHEMIRAGRTTAEIMEATGARRETVNNWRSEMGLSRKPPPLPRDEGIALLRAGVAAKDIAARFSCAIGTVHHWASESGIPLQATRTPKADAILTFLRDPGGWDEVRSAWLTGIRRHIERLRENAHAR